MRFEHEGNCLPIGGGSIVGQMLHDVVVLASLANHIAVALVERVAGAAMKERRSSSYFSSNLLAHALKVIVAVHEGAVERAHTLSDLLLALGALRRLQDAVPDVEAG